MTKPKILLVHGALTGASIWTEVVTELQDTGHEVLAPAMPLRGLETDAAYLAAFVDSLDGPVVLVGHSYGGTVISHPDLRSERVQAFVFVSAFSPIAGESTGELNGRWPGSKLVEENLTIRPYPGGSDLYLRSDRFGEVYAGDLQAPIVKRMAATQRPIDMNALGEAFSGTPAWEGRPCFAVISTKDQSLTSEAQRFMAQRMAATVVEVAASHASPVSQPKAVAELIIKAATV